MDFSTTVLKVRMNRKRMAVFLEDKIHIYDITTMNRVHSIECAPNINGIGALSSDADYPYLAYPAGNGGDISIFDTMTLRPVCNIPAHKTKLAVVNFSLNGEMLATASDKVRTRDKNINSYLLLCYYFTIHIFMIHFHENLIFRELSLESLAFQKGKNCINLKGELCRPQFIVLHLILWGKCYQ